MKRQQLQIDYAMTVQLNDLLLFIEIIIYKETQCPSAKLCLTPTGVMHNLSLSHQLKQLVPSNERVDQSQKLRYINAALISHLL